MNDSKEICLYFEKNSTYNPIDIAKEIQNRYKEIGEPIVLPVSNNKDLPLIVFQNNSDFYLRCNYHTLNFVVNHTYFKKIETIIFDLIDLFEESNVKFIRIGYICNIYLSSNLVDKYKKLYLKEDKVSDMEEYQIYLFKELKTKYNNINSWERIFSEGNNKHDLLLQYDFNSRHEDKIDFDMKYIKEFIKVSNEYIESRSL